MSARIDKCDGILDGPGKPHTVTHRAQFRGDANAVPDAHFVSVEVVVGAMNPVPGDVPRLRATDQGDRQWIESHRVEAVEVVRP